MSLHAYVRLRLGVLDLDVELDAPAGDVTAVLGPSGSGKTTLLRAMAGSVAIDAGRIRLDGRVLDEPPATFVPSELRRVGMLHQDYLLFPHLNVLENVAFGPRAQWRPADEARRSAMALLERAEMDSYARAKPRTLSGGQAQRVALARALATEPEALLLDEPFAALDSGTRVEVRRDLHRRLAGFTGPTILVTHDPVDVLALADRVAIIEAGRFTQTRTLAAVSAQPRSRYVAELLGTNLIHGSATGTTIRTESGLALVAADPHEGPVFATIAPADVALHHLEPEGSPRNHWLTRVSHLDLLGDRVRVRLAEPLDLVAEMTPAASAELGLREGDPVWVSIKATHITAYPI